MQNDALEHIKALTDYISKLLIKFRESGEGTHNPYLMQALLDLQRIKGDINVAEEFIELYDFQKNRLSEKTMPL